MEELKAYCKPETELRLMLYSKWSWKVFWIIVAFPWGIGPILYLVFGGGKFW